jgi:cyclase
MATSMFYEAGPIIFQRARELRSRPTDAEQKLWEHLRLHPCGYKFRRQHPLSNYIVDFYCHAKKLVIEADGPIHDRADIMMNDQEREAVLRSLRLTVLRFSNDEIMKNTEQVIKTIHHHLQNNTPL